MIERRLTEVAQRLSRLRSDLDVAEEQLAHLVACADDARVRSLVSETAVSERAHRGAARHARIGPTNPAPIGVVRRGFDIIGNAGNAIAARLKLIQHSDHFGAHITSQKRQDISPANIMTGGTGFAAKGPVKGGGVYITAFKARPGIGVRIGGINGASGNCRQRPAARASTVA